MTGRRGGGRASPIGSGKTPRHGDSTPRGDSTTEALRQLDAGTRRAEQAVAESQAARDAGRDAGRDSSRRGRGGRGDP